MERELRLSDLTIDPEFENLIRKQTPEEAESFEHQMLEHGGAHDPIMVWDNGGTYIILDGHHRYWFLLKHPDLIYRIAIAHEVHNRHEAEMWIFYQQKGKKNLTPFELSELALKFEPMLKEEARARMMAGKKLDPVQNSAPGSEKNKTRDEVARIAGVSHDTIDKTKKILAEGTKAQIESVRSGEKSINKVFNEIRPKPPKQKIPQTQQVQENQEEGEVDTEKKTRKYNTANLVPGGFSKEEQKSREQIANACRTLYDKDTISQFDLDALLRMIEINGTKSCSVLKLLLEQWKQLFESEEEKKAVEETINNFYWRNIIALKGEFNL